MIGRPGPAPDATDPAHDLVTMTLGGQEVAIPVAAVRDVLGPQPLTPVALAGPEIAGLLNLRGRVVTAVDLRRLLGVEAAGTVRERAMNVVIEHQGELYSLLVDSVGDVLTPLRDAFEHDTSLLASSWRRAASAVYALEDRTLVVLEVGRLLGADSAAA